MENYFSKKQAISVEKKLQSLGFNLVAILMIAMFACFAIIIVSLTSATKTADESILAKEKSHLFNAIENIRFDISEDQSLAIEKHGWENASRALIQTFGHDKVISLPKKPNSEFQDSIWNEISSQLMQKARQSSDNTNTQWSDTIRVGDMLYFASAKLREIEANTNNDTIQALVSYIRIDDKMMRLIEKNALVTNLEVQPSRDEKNDFTIELINASGEVLSYLAWTSMTPGSLISKNLAFPMAAISFIMLSLVGFVLVLARRTSNELRSNEERIHDASYRDIISSLGNRRYFEEKLKEVCEKSSLDPIVVIYIDLDRFREINESHGHHVGDTIIKQTGERLSTMISETAIAARTSGDQFALILSDLKSEDDLQKTCIHITDSLNAGFESIDDSSHLSCSIGAALAEADTADAGELMREADVALSDAKRGGGGRWSIYNPSMDDVIRNKKRIAIELRHAIDHDELEVWYQPQVSNDGKEILGVEALVRWRHPERGLVSPGEFIPVAEETGLIEPMGMWILRQSCEDAICWGTLSIAVNVSTQQLRHPSFIDRVEWVLAETGIEPERVELEVTESVVMGDEEIARAGLAGLHDIGVKVALDDFGTGYSSLSYLRRFPFDKLKIDRSFVASLGSADDAAAIIHSITGLADALGMETVAEGIETAAQHRFLQAVGCNRLQGYYFGRPMPAADFNTFMVEFKEKLQKEPKALKA
jgi:diguanylate cyclase (GGDEF)-like protein